ITAVALALSLNFCGVLAPASAGQNTSAATVIEETFVLKYLKPSALVSLLAQGDGISPSAKPGTVTPRTTSLLLADTIKSVVPDDVFNTVTIQGAPEAIASIRKVALLLDVPPQPVRLAVRIIRYRSAAAQQRANAGPAPLADVEEVASGIVETSSNTSVELTTYGDRHTFRARLTPHINNEASVSVAADLLLAAPDGTFAPFPVNPSGTRQMRVGVRGLITSLGTGISTASRPADKATKPEVTGAKAPEKAAPETYYLEVTPTLPSAPAALSSGKAGQADPKP
ncbi:MAG: secretin N-terminal domain-containing protein, partial [Armatimonadota bacterium]